MDNPKETNVVSITPFNKLNITKVVKRNGEVADFA